MFGDVIIPSKESPDLIAQVTPRFPKLANAQRNPGAQLRMQQDRHSDAPNSEQPYCRTRLESFLNPKWPDDGARKKRQT